MDLSTLTAQPATRICFCCNLFRIFVALLKLDLYLMGKSGYKRTDTLYQGVWL
jgi:hypothetical protein